MPKELKVDYCSYEAAKFACTHFHYSHSIPASRLIKHGVWEDGKWVGAVLYGKGATPAICSPYNLSDVQIVELVRIALTNHESNVTEIVSKSIKLLKKDNPKLELIVSYADSNQDHLGIIYQAGNWIYEGPIFSDNIIINGKQTHRRTITSKYGTSKIEWLRKNVDPNARINKQKCKFKYLMPLTKRARRKYEHLHQSYPKIIE